MHRETNFEGNLAAVSMSLQEEMNASLFPPLQSSGKESSITGIYQPALQLHSQSDIEIQSHVNKAGGVGFTSLNMFIAAAGPAHAGWEIPVMDASLHAALEGGKGRRPYFFQ